MSASRGSAPVRAKAHGAACDRYLGFKNVVRNTYGSSSIHYRRIHIRRNGQLIIEDDVDPNT